MVTTFDDDDGDDDNDADDHDNEDDRIILMDLSTAKIILIPLVPCCCSRPIKGSFRGKEGTFI